MAEKRPGFSDERRSDNDNRKPRVSDTSTKSAPPVQRKASVGQRWNAMQPSKTLLAWLCLGMIAGTMLVGFTWGGWVTDSTSQKAATTMANDAVVQRLSSICVAQFQQDPNKDEKLAELKLARTTQQRIYVQDQGWSLMPGEEESDIKVASACAKVLAQLE